jgi:hypothetical protein
MKYLAEVKAYQKVMNCIVRGLKAMQYLAGGKLTIYSRGLFL